MIGGRDASLDTRSSGSGPVSAWRSRRSLDTAYRFDPLACCPGLARWLVNRPARFACAVLVAQVIALCLHTVAFADVTLGSTTTYTDGEAALLGYFGEETRNANLHFKSDRLRYDGQPYFEVVVSQIEVSGNNYVYVGSDAFLQKARDEYEGIFHVGDGGGGGGHSIDPSTPSTIHGYSIADGGFYRGDSEYWVVPVGLPAGTRHKLVLNASTTATVREYKDAGLNIAIVCKINDSDQLTNLYVMGLPEGVYVVSDADGKVQIYNSNDVKATVKYRYRHPYLWNKSDDAYYVNPDSLRPSLEVWPSMFLSGTNEWDTSRDLVNYVFFLGHEEPSDNPSGGGDEGGGGDDGGGGDNEPTAPEPPEIEPREYNTYEGDEYDITVNVDFPDGTVDLSPITDRLDYIYARLGEIGIDLLNFDQHMQTEFYNLRSSLEGLFSSYFGSLTTWLQLIYSRLSDINRNLTGLDKSTDDKTDVTGIESLLRTIDADIKSISSDVSEILDEISAFTDDFAVWGMHIKSTLDDILFDFDSLLRRPWPTSNPTVPTPNPDKPIGEQVGEKMAELARHFPFSLPWDVNYILGLFAADPVTPQFVLPVLGSDGTEMYVDLTPWDSVAEVSRKGSVVLFALGLALRSRMLIANWGSSGD